MKKITTKEQQRIRRHKRIRSRIVGTMERPRLSVFRSNKFVYAQIIDDTAGKTLVAASTAKLTGKGVMEKAFALGKEIAKKAKDAKIGAVVFDRGGFLFTGKIKAVADGAREGGLAF
jgi:large subunit ribosomal protein L18